MVTIPDYKSQSAVYPGIYTPMPRTGSPVVRSWKKSPTQTANAPVRQQRNKDCIVLHLPLPACSREDIFIDGHNNLLSVYVPHYISANNMPAHGRQKKPHTPYYQRFINVPANTDVAFAQAKYQEGVLSIYIPVTLTPLQQQKPYRIVVY